jgi:phosphatidylglycerophosphate synthase
MGFEDILDRTLHRPLAAGVVRMLLPLGVSGNQVTIARVLLGSLGTALLAVGFFATDVGPGMVWAWAAALFFVAMVLDCADGQLARARGSATRLGRVLDGVSDILVFLPAYVVLAFGVLHVFGFPWFVLTAVAGFSMWFHCLVFDRLKLLRTGGEVESTAAVRGELAGASVLDVQAGSGGGIEAQALALHQPVLRFLVDPIDGI